jgi:hypothetical protein
VLVQGMVETLDFDNLTLHDSFPTLLNPNVLAIFNKLHVLACSEFLNKPNVRSTGKLFDSDDKRVMSGSLQVMFHLMMRIRSNIQKP